MATPWPSSRCRARRGSAALSCSTPGAAGAVPGRPCAHGCRREQLFSQGSRLPAERGTSLTAQRQLRAHSPEAAGHVFRSEGTCARGGAAGGGSVERGRRVPTPPVRAHHQRPALTSARVCCEAGHTCHQRRPQQHAHSAVVRPAPHGGMLPARDVAAHVCPPRHGVAHPASVSCVQHQGRAQSIACSMRVCTRFQGTPRRGAQAGRRWRAVAQKAAREPAR